MERQDAASAQASTEDGGLCKHDVEAAIDRAPASTAKQWPRYPVRAGRCIGGKLPHGATSKQLSSVGSSHSLASQRRTLWVRPIQRSTVPRRSLQRWSSEHVVALFSGQRCHVAASSAGPLNTLQPSSAVQPVPRRSLQSWTSEHGVAYSQLRGTTTDTSQPCELDL